MSTQDVPVSQSPSFADAPYVKTYATVVELCHSGRHVIAPISQLIEVMRSYDAGLNPEGYRACVEALHTVYSEGSRLAPTTKLQVRDALALAERKP